MEHFIIYDTETGAIERQISTIYPETVQENLRMGLAAMALDQPLSEGPHYVEGGEVVSAPPQPSPFHRFDYSARAWALDEVALARHERNKRNRLLAESDWSQMPDAPGDKAAWAQYRQGLRDVPAQPGFPSQINWPSAPDH